MYRGLSIMQSPTVLGTSALRLSQVLHASESNTPDMEYAGLDAQWGLSQERAVEWAREIGIIDLSQALWNKQQLAEFSFEPLNALLPSAAAAPGVQAVLDLASAWLLWIHLAFDFFHSRYVESRDVAGAKEFLDQLFALLSSCKHGDAHKLQNPVERGLAALWTRSASVASAEWQKQFRTGWRILAAGLLHQISELIRNRTPQSAGSTELLKQTWSSHLLERLAALYVSESRA